MRPVFFKTSAELRRWLQAHHDTAGELLIGFYKKASGRGGVNYPQALEEALCFGWIDGITRRLDEDSYAVRFSPRTQRSYWSAVNVKRAEALIAAGRMTAAGRRAFERRDAERTKQHSYERAHAELPAPYVRQFRGHKAAWAYFEAQPPSYRRVASWYVISARKEDTRQRRLEHLIAESAKGQRIGLLTSPAKADRIAPTRGSRLQRSQRG